MTSFMIVFAMPAIMVASMLLAMDRLALCDARKDAFVGGAVKPVHVAQARAHAASAVTTNAASRSRAMNGRTRLRRRLRDLRATLGSGGHT